MNGTISLTSLVMPMVSFGTSAARDSGVQIVSVRITLEYLVFNQTIANWVLFISSPMSLVHMRYSYIDYTGHLILISYSSNLPLFSR